MALNTPAKKDWFNTYLYLYIIFAVIIPLLFIASIMFERRQITIQVVEPKQYSNNLSQIQQIDLQNSKKGQVSSQNIGLEYKQSDIVNVNIDYNGIDIPLVKIKAGDTVVFKNSTFKPITITSFTWGSGEAVLPTKSYAQKFDFKGEFTYTAGQVSGKIIVQ